MPTKILAIDDSKTMRLAIKITFAAEDAEVVAVSKGSEAVVRAKQMGADVILIDHQLADGEPSGYDVCRALKSDAVTAGIPVIVMVPSKTGGDQGRLASSGADGWLGKPFDTQELIDKVAALVGQGAGRPVAAAPSRPISAPQPAAAPMAASPQAARPSVTATQPMMSAPRPAPSAQRATMPAAAPAPAAVTSRPAAAPAQLGGASRPAAAAAARPAAVLTQPAHGADIPIAVPIPFTAADSPTPGMLRRLQEAGGAAAGLDPRTAAALVALSREVVEQVVWEVVPELAEQIIREVRAKTA